MYSHNLCPCKKLVIFSFFFILAGCSKSPEEIIDSPVPEAKVVLPKLTTTTVSGITFNSAISGGNIIDDGGGNIMEAGICWSTSSMPDIEDSKFSRDMNSSNFSGSMTKLLENTTYYVRSYATNSAGTGYGDQKEFTTEELVFEQKIFDGDVLLTNQEEVDVFAEEHYTEITGSLQILQNSEPVISDVSALISIEKIGKNLIIKDLNQLVNFNGLQHLKLVEGNVTIIQNEGLAALDGLRSLTTVNGDFGLAITHNSGLVSLDGLSSLQSAKVLHIGHLNSLTSIPALDNLFELGSLIISTNKELTKIDGFNNIIKGLKVEISLNTVLESIQGFQQLDELEGRLLISYNESLKNIGGFQSLQTLGGDLSIVGNNGSFKLDGFNSLRTVKNVEINKNPGISEITGLNKLESVSNVLEIWWNDNLILLQGFERLNSVGRFVNIHFNSRMKSLAGFHALMDVMDYVSISHNYNMERLSGFDNMSNLSGNLHLESNYLLTVFDGFQNLESVNMLEIGDSHGLKDLKNFASLSQAKVIEIKNNQELISLEGLNQITAGIEAIIISGNPSLSDYCILLPLFMNGWNGHFSTDGNEYNPSFDDMVAGNCQL